MVMLENIPHCVESITEQGTCPVVYFTERVSARFNHLFFFFFNSVLRPFQDYFSSYETGQSVGG